MRYKITEEVFKKIAESMLKLWQEPFDKEKACNEIVYGKHRNKLAFIISTIKVIAQNKKIYFEFIKIKFELLHRSITSNLTILLLPKNPQLKLLKNIFGNNASETHN